MSAVDEVKALRRKRAKGQRRLEIIEAGLEDGTFQGDHAWDVQQEAFDLHEAESALEELEHEALGKLRALWAMR